MNYPIFIQNKLLSESLFIGLYSCVIYLLVSFTTNSSNFNLLLFTVGFLKHFLGYYLKIQDYYCNSCLTNSKSKTTTTKLIVESILEGGVFIILGLLLKLFIENRFLLIFLLGFLLHTVAEFAGIHKYFCKSHCVIQRRP